MIPLPSAEPGDGRRAPTESRLGEHAAETSTALIGRNDFTKVPAGQAVSGVGDWMATTAFMAPALDLTGSPTAVAGVLVVRLLPGLVAGPIAARVSSRWAARRTMPTMDVLRRCGGGHPLR